MDYRVVKSSIKFKGEVVTVRVDELKMPSGRVVEREVLTHLGAVGMVPVLDTGEIVLVKQYRHATGKYLLEIPAGKLKAGEDAVACAQRELKEEIGMAAAEMVPLARFYTTPGYSDEYFYLFLARHLRPEHVGEPEEEIVSEERLSLEEALRLVDRGEIEDGKTIAGLALAKVYLSR